MSVSCLPHPVAVSVFMICRGLCASVSFGAKVRPRTFGCVAMGSALLFIVRSRLFVYSAGSVVNSGQVVLSRQPLFVGMIVFISWLNSCFELSSNEIITVLSVDAPNILT